jgi:hypothetical protein
LFESQKQGIHPRPIKQKQAQLHVLYSTRHDKLDECKIKPALPQLVTIGDNIMAKNSIMPHRSNRPKNQSQAWALRGVLSVTA